MTSSYDFFIADERHDQAIEQLLAIATIGKEITISTRYKPSFTKAMHKLSTYHEIILCRQHNKVIGMGVIDRKDVYMQGQREALYYLSNLRFFPEHRGQFQLSRAFQYFIERYKHNRGYYLTSIMDDNLSAKKILASRRRGVPNYIPITKLKTFLLKKWSGAVNKNISVKCATEISTLTINSYLKHEGKRKEFFPICQVNTKTRCFDNMPGLALENCFVAMKGTEMVGILGMLDQSDTKSMYVKKYHSVIKLLRPGYNVISPILPYPKLPIEGQDIKMVYASCQLIKDSKPEVLSCLISAVIKKLSKDQVFVVAITESDPLLKLFDKLSLYCMESTLYGVDVTNIHNHLDTVTTDGVKPLHIEIGSL